MQYFDPVHFVLLMAWFAAGLYSLTLIADYEGRLDGFKPLLNTLALFFGPVILLLFGGNKLYQEQIKARIFKPEPAPEIDILDSRGKSVISIDGSSGSESLEIMKQLIFA